MTDQALKSSGIKKYEYIDILRAIAILGVIAVHSHQGINGLSTITSSIFNYGQLGVQLFFIASALTLCLSATERKEQKPINFYIRRFFRIAPLYYFGIALYFVWRTFIHFYSNGELAIPQGYTVLAVLENIFFVHGFHPSNFAFVVPGGWSIATEMAFYAVFPLLFMLLNKLSLKNFIAFSLVIATLSFAVQYYAIFEVQPLLVAKGILKGITTNDDLGYLYALILNQINVFLVGLIAFKLLNKKITTIQILLAVCLMVVSCVIQNDRSYDTGLDGVFYPILSAIAFSILAIKLSQISISSHIVCKALTKIGQNSYSMYLMHFLVLDVLRLVFKNTIYKTIDIAEFRLAMIFTAVTALTYLAATVTNKYIEQPGISLGKRFVR